MNYKLFLRFIYLYEIVTARQRWREREKGSSTCWFTPHMAAVAGAGPNQSWEPRNPTLVPGSKKLDLLLPLLQAYLEGAGSEIEQLRFEPIPIRDTSIAGKA